MIGCDAPVWGPRRGEPFLLLDAKPFDVDGAPLGSVIREGIKRPFMFLLSGHGDPSDPENRQIWANIQSIYDRLPPDGRLRIEILGANHFLFSDDGALLKSHVLLGTLRILGILGIDGRRQLLRCTLRFMCSSEVAASDVSRH